MKDRYEGYIYLGKSFRDKVEFSCCIRDSYFGDKDRSQKMVVSILNELPIIPSVVCGGESRFDFSFDYLMDKFQGHLRNLLKNNFLFKLRFRFDNPDNGMILSDFVSLDFARKAVYDNYDSAFAAIKDVFYPGLDVYDDDYFGSFYIKENVSFYNDDIDLSKKYFVIGKDARRRMNKPTDLDINEIIRPVMSLFFKDIFGEKVRFEIKF